MFPTDPTKISDDYLDDLMSLHVPPPITISPDEKFQQKLRAVSEEAYWDATKQFLKTCFLRQMVSNLAEGQIEDYSKLPIKQLQMIQQQSDKLSTKSPYYFITINPKPGVTLEELRNLVEHKKKSLINKKSVKSYMLVYEIRNKDEKKYSGLHCHILLEQSIRPHDFKRSLKNTFKNVCDINNPHILNFKNIPNIEIMNQKIQYMLGEKSDKKIKGVEYTKEWRALKNIPKYIESNPPLPCRVTQKNTPQIDEI